MRPTQTTASNLVEIYEERQFKTFLINFGFLDPRTFESYKRFRSALEREILLNNPESHSLELKLWKLCHYKLIEDFRKAFKSATLGLNTGKQNGPTNLGGPNNGHTNGGGAVNSGGAKQEQMLKYASLVSKFRELLIESQGFYLNFISKIFYLYGPSYICQSTLSDLNIVLLDHSDSLQRPTHNLPPKDRIHATLYRCLIALGDIARYKDSTVDKGIPGQYLLAKKYYWRALSLAPDNGNTYNQLAVLEAYNDRFTFALDLYLKSLCVPVPFSISISNLSPLFTKAQSKESLLEASFVLLLSKLLPSHKNLSQFKNDQKPFLDLLTARLENGPVDGDFIDTLHSMVSATLGLLHLLLNALLPRDDEAGDTLGHFVLELARIILDAFCATVACDLEALDVGYEVQMSVVAMVMRVVLHPWIYARGVGAVMRSVGRVGTGVARVLGERFPVGSERRVRLREDERWEAGCLFLREVVICEDESGGEEVVGEGDGVRVRCNQILYAVRQLCAKEPPLLFQNCIKGVESFSVTPPISVPRVDSASSTPVAMQWRGAQRTVTSSSSTAPATYQQSPLSPIHQTHIDPTHTTTGSGQINMTLSYLGLGLGSPSPMAATAKFILPESAVKRMPLQKASFPSPIGSAVEAKPTFTHAGNHNMQALFSNAFTPGLELVAMQPTSSFDALFARLTPYQQSMVSPSPWPWSDESTSGTLVPPPVDPPCCAVKARIIGGGGGGGGGMQVEQHEEIDASDHQRSYINSEELPECDVRVFIDDDDGKEKLQCTHCDRMMVRKGGYLKLLKACMSGKQVKNGDKPIAHFPVMEKKARGRGRGRGKGTASSLKPSQLPLKRARSDSMDTENIDVQQPAIPPLQVEPRQVADIPPQTNVQVQVADIQSQPTVQLQPPALPPALPDNTTDPRSIFCFSTALPPALPLVPQTILPDNTTNPRPRFSFSTGIENEVPRIDRTDITAKELRAIAEAMEVDYLGPAAFPGTFPAVGDIWNPNHRLVVSLVCRRRTTTSSMSSSLCPARNIIFLIDTGSPSTYLCQQVVEELIGRDTYLPQSLWVES